MTPLLVFDARMVLAVPDGPGQYARLLLRGLADRALPYEIAVLEGPDSPRDPGWASGFRRIRARARYLSPAELLEVPLLLRRARADAYHATTFSSCLSLGPLVPPCPWISTVHDLNHLVYGSPAKQAYYRFVLRPFVRTAAAALSVSKFSARALESWAGIGEVEVATNALDPDSFAPPADLDERLSSLSLGRGSYFLCLGNRKAHKNLALLIRAYSRARREAPGLWPLVLAVRPVQGEPDERGVKRVGGISSIDGSALLHGAGALVAPSLFEGFGRPAVEASAIGVPAIVSSIEPHLETLGWLDESERVFADPRDEGAWVKALLEVWRAASRGGAPRARPETQAKLREAHSPRAVAEVMDRVYRRVLGIDPS